MRTAAVHYRVFQLVIDMPAIRFKNDADSVGRQVSISSLRIKARDLESFIAGQAPSSGFGRTARTIDAHMLIGHGGNAGQCRINASRLAVKIRIVRY